MIGLNDESFSVAVCINAKKKSVLGEMLGDAVRPAPACKRSASKSGRSVKNGNWGKFDFVIAASILTRDWNVGRDLTIFV